MIGKYRLTEFVGCGLLLLLSLIPVDLEANVNVTGALKKWHPVTIDVSDPALVTNELAQNPNPFLDYRYDVIFTAPSGGSYRVPGFYAGDGQGNGQGSVWRARFSPDELGVWSYTISFRSGPAVAVDLHEDAGLPVAVDGLRGNFTVTEQDSGARGFLRYGRLQYNGSHYLKFADGPYWIKGGVDSPENFFGFAGFDNTVDQLGGSNSGALLDGLHHYQDHIGDWQPGDPDFSNSQTGISGKAIIGAINYLASEGVNSIYFLPMNLGGDGRDTYPFIDTDGSFNANTHFDISKLFQWNLVLQHMQNNGIAAHIVLSETETGNTEWFDQGELGTERKLFFRELVARFSYLLAIKWNLGEESRHGTVRHRDFAEYLRQLDWAQHPVTVHTHLDKPAVTYDHLLGDTAFDCTSIQFSPDNADEMVETWRSLSQQAGWPWVLDMDEVGPGAVGLTDQNIDELRKKVLYAVYLSGGNLEWYFGYHALPLGGDIRTENFRTREPMYRQMRFAREWVSEHLPFWEMQPNDLLHSAAESSGVQVFEKPGVAYALYLPQGNIGGELTVLQGNYTLQWFNPRSGTAAGQEQTISGGTIELTDPPDIPEEDWLVLIKAIEAPPEQPLAETEQSEPELGAAQQQGQAQSTSKAGGLSVVWNLALMLLLGQRVLRDPRGKAIPNGLGRRPGE